MANRCPIDGCPRERKSKQLMCRSHWYKVPKELRDKVWRTAEAMWADESDLPSGTYTAWSEARSEAIAAVELKEAS